MSLDQLKDFNREADNLSGQSSRYEGAQKILASTRNGPRPLSVALQEVIGRWKYGGDEIARAELYSVLDEMGADIYRIAEMRLAAKARLYKVKAAQRRAIVTASILPIPEIEKEQEL